MQHAKSHHSDSLFRRIFFHSMEEDVREKEFVLKIP
jgi:hypothetical protein